MYSIIHEPVVWMRGAPTDAAKVVSQALFGEEVGVEERRGDWALIRTPDGYRGWVPMRSLAAASYLAGETAILSRLAGHVYAMPDIEFGPKKTLPYGARVKVVRREDARWVKIAMFNGEEGYIQKGDIAPEKKIGHKKNLVSFGKRFLGLPYTWGGRSSFGYDCSGFVQMLYGRLGLLLPRDAKDQALDPRLEEIPMEKLEPGDLVFFGKASGQIAHVALFAGNGKILHASSKENKPYLRISSLLDEQWSGGAGCGYPFRTARRIR